ncbi:penicillin acylase family protein [Pendulispora rubella]|uniref:Penicillin acylase family protein n=1 Tax=Pendulispora rubella TaxID=2741070 RepID=A0ABZ2KVM6_9BACT
MKWWLKAIAGIAAVGVLSASGGTWYAARSLPQVDGEVTLAGMSAPIEIVRDASAVPHIYAATERDAYFGLGYVHAQDRLWQMELGRRLGSGTLSEILGAAALEQDRAVRTMGLRHVAEENLRVLDPDARAMLDAYVAGVNALLDEKRPLPPEFAVLRTEPSPWTAIDSLVWLRVMATTLAGNLDQEMQRLALRAKLSPKQISELFAPYPDETLPPLPDSRALYGQIDTEAREVLAKMPRRAAGSVGSNNWVVDGRRTETGKPLLANDPHLQLTAPAVWYFAHLSAPGLNVIGGTFPGVPGVVLGRNDHVAWAFTNTISDTQDFFVEKPAPDDPASYLTPSGRAPFQVRDEVIRIKDAPDETLRVRSTRHGPIVSELKGMTRTVPDMPPGYLMALRSVVLEHDDRSLEFPLRAAHAKNADEFLAATKSFHSPQQNIVYADGDGAIGFIAAGRVPLRGVEDDVQGRIPVPGWVDRYDWTGFIPWEDLPQVRNPESGKIVTANQKITPLGYPHSISSDWVRPYRSERISTLLDATAKHATGSFEKIQLDLHSGSAAVLLPHLIALGGAAARDGDEKAIFQRLRGWNGDMVGTSLEPLVFAAWVRELDRVMYEDEVGDLFPMVWAERIDFLDHVLSNVDGQNRWCDDVRTPSPESCQEAVETAYRNTMAYLKKEFGTHYEDWTWGAAHPSHSAHMVLGQVPLLGRWFNVDVPGVGDNETVNVGGYAVDAPEQPFCSGVGPGFRAVYDLADLEKSVFVLSTGQSGHPLSSHYRDLNALWSRGEYVPLRTGRPSADAGRIGLLRLRPR